MTARTVLSLLSSLILTGCTLFEVSGAADINAQLCSEDSPAVICCREALVFDMDAALNGDKLIIKCREHPEPDGYGVGDGGGGDVP